MDINIVIIHALTKWVTTNRLDKIGIYPMNIIYSEHHGLMGKNNGTYHQQFDRWVCLKMLYTPKIVNTLFE